MPKVGDKHFAYTDEGKKEAQKYAKEKGLEVINRKYYASGGAVYSSKPIKRNTGGPSKIKEKMSYIGKNVEKKKPLIKKVLKRTPAGKLIGTAQSIKVLMEYVGKRAKKKISSKGGKKD